MLCLGYLPLQDVSLCSEKQMFCHYHTWSLIHRLPGTSWRPIPKTATLRCLDRTVVCSAPILQSSPVSPGISKQLNKEGFTVTSICSVAGSFGLNCVQDASLASGYDLILAARASVYVSIISLCSRPAKSTTVPLPPQGLTFFLLGTSINALEMLICQVIILHVMQNCQCSRHVLLRGARLLGCKGCCHTSDSHAQKCLNTGLIVSGQTLGPYTLMIC